MLWKTRTSKLPRWNSVAIVWNLGTCWGWPGCNECVRRGKPFGNCSKRYKHTVSVIRAAQYIYTRNTGPRTAGRGARTLGELRGSSDLFSSLTLSNCFSVDWAISCHVVFSLFHPRHQRVRVLCAVAQSRSSEVLQHGKVQTRRRSRSRTKALSPCSGQSCFGRQRRREAGFVRRVPNRPRNRLPRRSRKCVASTLRPIQR